MVSQNENERPANVPIPDPSFLTTQQLMREIQNLRELMESRIDHVEELSQTRFKERDLRFEQRDQDQRDAVGAALAAAKEAVGKSEQMTDKRLDAIAELIAQKDETRAVQIGDINKRLDRNEGKGQGLSQAWGIGIAGITVLIGILTVVIIILSR